METIDLEAKPSEGHQHPSAEIRLLVCNTAPASTAGSATRSRQHFSTSRTLRETLSFLTSPLFEDGSGQCDIVAGGVDASGVFKGIYVPFPERLARLAWERSVPASR